MGEDLYRFIDQISHFLCSYVRPTGWLIRLKNAVKTDTRAFDSVLETARTAAYMLRTDPDLFTGRPTPPTRDQRVTY